MDSRLIEKLKRELKDKSRKIVIVTHTNPDGDAIGSSLGLYGILSVSGFSNVKVVVPNDYPTFLKWMAFDDVVVNGKRNPHLAEEIIAGSELIFCLDFNDIGRTDNLERHILKSNSVKVLIDHHPEPRPDFDILISNTNVSSTSELVYECMLTLGFASGLNREIAECFYAGIVTDTGSFSYSCNLPRTYEIMAILMSAGLDCERLHRLIYSTYSEDRLRLLGYCLSEKLVVMADHQTAYISLNREELNRFRHRVGDTEGIVNYALSIENIHLAALFTENQDHIRISLRSTDAVDVNILARKSFNGGGHKSAAGGKSYVGMAETLAQFEAVIREMMPPAKTF